MNSTKHFLFLFFCSFISTWTLAQFSQVGSQLDGNAPNDNFGWSVAMDDAGKTIAVGAPLFDNDFGQVRVYQQSGGEWVQLGGDIDGTEIGQQFGFSLDLNATGRRLALGGLSGNPSSLGGHVRVYDYKNGDWEQVGSTILGEATGDQFGVSLALNEAGNRIVVGARNNDGNGNESGHVRVFELQGGEWTQLGADIDGENAGDLFGSSVSMSWDGNIIAVGASRNGGTAPSAGQVRIYQWQNGVWMQMGADIDGQDENEFLGASISLSEDGDILATGVAGDEHANGFGAVRVYQLMNNMWTQMGADIQGMSMTEAFGQYVTISSDGMTVGIGTQSADDVAMSSGRVNIFTFDNGVWTEVYSPILGQATFDNLGKSIAFNQEANRFVIGANLAGGTQGYAVVYENSQMPVGLANELRPHSMHISATQEMIDIRLELENRTDAIEISLLGLDGRQVYSQIFAYNSDIRIKHQLPKGVYLIHVAQNQKKLFKKVAIR